MAAIPGYLVAGSFSTLAQAQSAIRDLQAAGFPNCAIDHERVNDGGRVTVVVPTSDRYEEASGVLNRSGAETAWNSEN